MTDSYDDIPYDSMAIFETHPANLAMPGLLFGLAPAPPERARVLELGCASGGNLIPMAWHLPNGEFVGVERAAAQAATGQALAAALGLRNIRIIEADVQTLDLAALGEFDYIVAHGFYSWVPAPVRERLFEICTRLLAPQGIAYVSYNTLPGWRQRGMLRDLLLHEARDAATPRARLEAVQNALAPLAAAFAERDDPVSAYLRDELERLRTRHPSYLYHEYLAEENVPVLFRDFMASAARHGLQYLCETELRTMFAPDLGPAALALVERGDDIVEQEQMLDFLYHRFFRQTLLCRAGLDVTRELELGRFEGFAWHALLLPPAPPDLGRAEAEPFHTPEGAVCVATHPLAKAALLELADAYPSAVDYPALLACARARVRAAGGPADETDALLPELVRLYLRQALGLSPQAEAIARGAGDCPRATVLARAQAQANLGHVVTVRHMTMGLDAFTTRLLMLLDGRCSRSELVARLVEDVEAGRLAHAGEPSDRTALTADMTANVERMLEAFARHGLLESD
jgi:SAM-dependent methyltransferase